MGLVISERDLSCRYLAEHSSTGGAFSLHLAALSFELPRGMPLEALVGWGFIRPRLRVALPPSLIRSWPHFPELGHDFSLRSQDLWANHLYVYSSVGALWEAEPSTREWFEHPFDRRVRGQIATNAFRHRLGVSPRAKLPRRGRHPDGRLIAPWLDFFARWQIYELLDILQAARLVDPIVCSPNTPRVLLRLMRHYAAAERWSKRWVRWRRRDWARLALVFDWISRDRTMRTAAHFARPPILDLRGARSALVARYRIHESPLRSLLTRDLVQLGIG